MRVLGAKGRPEGVHLRQREAVGLDVELPRHREEGLAPEEVLAEVDLAVRAARQVGEVEGRDAEQLPRALGVGRGDDRGVDPEEIALVEKAVDRLRRITSYNVCYTKLLRDSYPIQPKPHTLEFLREVAHLRPRTNVIGAATRVRHTLAQRNNFV